VTGLVVMLAGLFLVASGWTASAQAERPKVDLDIASKAPAGAADVDPDNPYSNWFFSVWSSPILADGEDFGVITAVARDANNGPLTGKADQLTASLVVPEAMTRISDFKPLPNAPGSYRATITSTLPGDKQVEVNTEGYPVAVSGNDVAHFVSPFSQEVSLEKSSWSVTPDGPLSADGESSYTGLAVVRDTTDQPVAGQTVTFTAPVGVTSSVLSVVTDAQGEARTAFASTVVGTHSVSAGVDGVGTIGSVDISFSAGEADSRTSSFTLTPTALFVGESATASALVKDSHDHPVASQAVTFAATGSAQFPGGPSCLTDAEGTCSVAVTDAVSEDVTVTASISGGPIAPVAGITVSFTNKEAVPERSELVVTPASPLEVGQSVTATVTTRDVDGAPSPQQIVVFHLEPGDAGVLSQDSCVTGSDGTCSVTVTSKLAVKLAIHATLPTLSGPVDVGGNADPAKASPQPVHFVVGNVCVIEAGCRPEGSGTDPSKQTRVVVTTNDRPVSGLDLITGYAFDKYGNPTSGVVFSLSSEHDNLVFSAGTRGTGTMTSREDGTATLSAASDQAGSFAARALVAGVELSGHGSPLDLRFLGAPTITSPVDGTVSTDKAVTVTGVGQNPAATITVKDATVAVCTTPVQSDRRWSCTATLADGQHTVTAVETTRTGEVSPPSDPVTFTIDTEAPPAPVVTKPGDHDLTNHPKPVVSGTGNDPGNKVTVHAGDQVVCTTVVKHDLTWSCPLDQPLTDGDHTLTATETDQAGNVSDPSKTVTIHIDSQPPAAPVLTKPQDQAVTNQPTPEVSGTGQEPGNKLAIRAGDKVVCRTVVKPDLTWSCTAGEPLADGKHTLTADETDQAGNVSASSNAVAVTVDTQAPRTPTITTVGKFTIAGVGEPGSTLTLTYPVSELSTETVATVVDSTKNWSVPTPSDAVSGTITVVSTDKAGNDSKKAQAILDLTSPGAPIVRASNGSEVTGTAEPGSHLEITDDQGKTIPGCEEVFADVNGRFTCAPEQALSAGTTVTVRAEDKAGNVSPVTVVTIVAVKAEVTYPERHRLETQVVTGVHFNPDEQVCLSVVPSVEDVGCQTGDPTGKVTFSFTVPQGFQTGRHTVTLTGHTSGLASTSFAVVDTVAIETGGVVATPVTPGQLGLFAAVALLGAGASGMWFGVRRVNRASH